MKKYFHLLLITILIIFIVFSCQDDSNPLEQVKHGNLRRIADLPVAQGFVRSVAVSGDYAFLADTANGIRIADVSDRTNPQELTVYGGGNPPQRVFTAENYLFVTGSRINGLNILDISAPAAPAFLKNLPNIRDINDVYYEDSLLYIVSGSMGLLVYDLSNINHPDFCSSFYEGSLCRMNGVDITGILAYLADEFQFLRIVDVSDPHALRQPGIVPLDGPAADVCVSGERAYLACGKLGLFIYNVHDVKNVQPLGSFVLDSTQINQIEIRGSIVYASDLAHSFSLIDVSQPASCQQFASYSQYGYLHGFYLDGDYIYLAAGEEGMVILEYK